MSIDLKEELIQRADAFDRCWAEGRLNDLRRFLHADVVFTGPQFQRLAKGAEACVQSYVRFLAQAQVHEFTLSDYLVDIAGDAAVMTYRWTIDYEISGQRSRESGQDLLVWVREAGQWLITWRSQRPEGNPEA